MLKFHIKSGLKWICVALLVMGLDRLSKIWVLDHLTLAESLRILPIFNLTLAYNTGAAFSMLHSAAGWQNIFLSTLAIVVSLVIVFKLLTIRRDEKWVALSLSLILGGALGNVWDRMQYGYVIDFLHFHMSDWHFAIFNVADSAISVGAFMLIAYWGIWSGWKGSKGSDVDSSGKN